MTSVRRSLFVPFTSAEMFSLVNDVDKYPEFLPWCSATEVLVSNLTRMEATLSISKGRFSYDFSTVNTLHENESIRLDLRDGPFKNFSGLWCFADVDAGSLVEIALEFEFEGVILGAAVSLASGIVVDTLVDSFKRRAYKIYEDK